MLTSFSALFSAGSQCYGAHFFQANQPVGRKCSESLQNKHNVRETIISEILKTNFYEHTINKAGVLCAYRLRLCQKVYAKWMTHYSKMSHTI